MKRNQTSRIRQSAAQLLFGVAGLGVLTFVGFRLELHLAATAFAYLILIVLLSLMGSFMSSAALSLLAVGCLAYFFAPPIYDFRIEAPRDLVASSAFVITSLIVTGLVRRGRRLTEAARLFLRKRLGDALMSDAPAAA